MQASSAMFSPCRLYRYDLWRRWSNDPVCVFIGLNPSTADATKDDPTIRKCVGYATRWGYGSICMVNLFAFRASNPKDMLAAEYPIGADNDAVLRSRVAGAAIVIAAWGKYGGYMNRGKIVMTMLSATLQCLKHNKDGSPSHPLYLPYDVCPSPMDLSLAVK